VADEAFFAAIPFLIAVLSANATSSGALMRPAFDKPSMQSFPGENTRL
jgi:hypothetical protein